LARYIDRQVEFTQIANLKDKLLDAGLRGEYVDTLNTLDQLKEALANLPDESKSTKESKADIQRKFYEDNKAELDNIDESTLTEDEKAALDALKNIDVDQLLSTERGRRLLPLLAVATQNAITTGKFYNVGALIDEHKLQQRSSNQTIVEQVKSTVRVTKRWMNKVRKEGATTFGQIDAILKDRKKVGAFMELTGLDDYQKAYVRATKKVRDVLDRFNNLMEKHDKSLRNNAVERFLLGIYLDLNIRKASWTADEVTEQFNARKKAIEDSIERLEKQMGQDENLRKEKQTYLDNLKEAYNYVAPLASSEEIFDLLSTASKEVVNFMRTEFQAIRGGLQTN